MSPFLWVRSRHSLAGFSVSGSHDAAAKASAGLAVSPEAHLGRIHFQTHVLVDNVVLGS